MRRTVEAIFKKESSDEQMVWAEVYAPNAQDSDGEFMDAKGIREAAYRFMRAKKLDSIDSQHDNELVPGCYIIESFIARKGDPDFIEGAWVVGMHIDNDEMWGKIKKGEINGFSLEAFVVKQRSKIELTIPNLLNGRTSKAEDGHEHTFKVTYDDQGRFQGGTTGETNGHYHLIKRGTATEDEAGHSHRFSHVEPFKLREL